MHTHIHTPHTCTYTPRTQVYGSTEFLRYMLLLAAGGGAITFAGAYLVYLASPSKDGSVLCAAAPAAPPAARRAPCSGARSPLTARAGRAAHPRP